MDKIKTAVAQELTNLSEQCFLNNLIHRDVFLEKVERILDLYSPYLKEQHYKWMSHNEAIEPMKTLLADTMLLVQTNELIYAVKRVSYILKYPNNIKKVLATTISHFTLQEPDGWIYKSAFIKNDPITDERVKIEGKPVYFSPQLINADKIAIQEIWKLACIAQTVKCSDELFRLLYEDDDKESWPDKLKKTKLVPFETYYK